MQKPFTLLTAVLITAITFAQAPEKTKYQAVVRDEGGELVRNQSIDIQVSILENSAAGTAIYIETHVETTNGKGALNLGLGTGTSITGNFSSIDWGNGLYYLKTEITGNNNYTMVVGNRESASVPYALHAQSNASEIGLTAIDNLNANTVQEALAELKDQNKWTISGSDVYFNEGNVGIGTNSPGAKLEIAGTGINVIDGDLLISENNANCWASLKFINNDIASSQGAQIGLGGSASFFSSYKSRAFFVSYANDYEAPGSKGMSFILEGTSSGPQDWRFIDGNQLASTRVIIKQNGNVGIGTTNPTEKLAVNGTVKAKDFLETSSGWSDFVFEEDYDLPTLEEVEKHIADKGHLKDIPSAEEVAEKGIFLGEMSSKLLQKIEELTLYTIAQEKELKFQDDKLKTQGGEIEKLKKG